MDENEKSLLEPFVLCADFSCDEEGKRTRGTGNCRKEYKNRRERNRRAEIKARDALIDVPLKKNIFMLRRRRERAFDSLMDMHSHNVPA